MKITEEASSKNAASSAEQVTTSAAQATGSPADQVAASTSTKVSASSVAQINTVLASKVAPTESASAAKTSLLSAAKTSLPSAAMITGSSAAMSTGSSAEIITSSSAANNSGERCHFRCEVRSEGFRSEARFEGIGSEGHSEGICVCRRFRSEARSKEIGSEGHSEGICVRRRYSPIEICAPKDSHPKLAPKESAPKEYGLPKPDSFRVTFGADSFGASFGSESFGAQISMGEYPDNIDDFKRAELEWKISVASKYSGCSIFEYEDSILYHRGYKRWPKEDQEALLDGVESCQHEDSSMLIVLQNIENSKKKHGCLKAYSVCDRDVGYVQMSEEDPFWLLVPCSSGRVISGS
ncbi:unnamed protein product [Linum tenue]|uniref:Uncharacterized protein n=1 Tax=Linum tenue TaxID=586396 RepID=A0AAV0MY32_9ROSI|nr:unnamed protein product [Linum tenue]